MLQNGIIKTSVSPWASLVALVRKADQTLQLCIDYRNLNKATIKDLPHIQDTLYGNTLFTTIKLPRAYHQIKVEESSRENTAFTTNAGLFQYISLPFILTNASASQEKSGVVIPITISSQIMFSLGWYRFSSYPTQWVTLHHTTRVKLSSLWGHRWCPNHIGNRSSWYSRAP